MWIKDCKFNCFQSIKTFYKITANFQKTMLFKIYKNDHPCDLFNMTSQRESGILG